MPTEPGTDDTGLHIAMRLLLGIVAGLLVSDILKAFVETVVGDKQSCCPALLDSVIVLGAMLFIVRVVVDNVLHYHEVDPIAGTGVCATRVVLIVLDLMSY